MLVSAACGMPIGFSSILLPQLVLTPDDSRLNKTVASPPLQPHLIGSPELETLWMDMEMGSWISSIHSAATPIGCFLSGSFNDRFGRRMSLLVSIVPLIISWVIMALSHTHIWMLVARICGGFAVGFLSAPAQIYIAEIAEPHLRGILIGSPFVAYSLGILFVFILGFNFSWRFVAWAGILLPCISWLLLLPANESPVWLVRNGRKEEAFKSMRWLRDNDRIARDEVNELVERYEEERGVDDKDQSLWQLLKHMDVIKPLVIINIFNIFQILSGTLTIVFYAVPIIKEFTSESSHVDAGTAALLSAVVRFLITLAYSVILMYVRRRTMVNWAGTAAAIGAFFLGILVVFKEEVPPEAVFPLACLLLVVYLCGSTCLFIMCGVSIGEMLPSKVRGKVSGYIFAILNIVLFTLVKIFPTVVSLIGISGLFFSFSLGSFLATLTMYLMMPETKGRKLTEIEDYFKGDNWLWSKRK